MYESRVLPSKVTVFRPQAPLPYPATTYRSPAPRHHQPQRQSSGIKLSWCALFAIIFIILVIFGATIAFCLVFGTKPAEEPKVCNKVSYDMTLRFADLTFTSDLDDISSAEYSRLRNRFCSDVTTGLTREIPSNKKCGESATACEVKNFRSGSVIVDFKISQNELQTMSTFDRTKAEDDMKTAMDTVIFAGQSGSDTENIFKNSVSGLTIAANDISEANTLVQCPPVYIPKDASITSGPSGPAYSGDTLVITCDAGFRIAGDRKEQLLTCTSSGSYDNEILTCEALMCPDVTNLDNRMIQTGQATGNVYKSVVTTKCNDGYSLDMDDPLDITSVIECQENGQWNMELPMCHALQCPEVTLPMKTVLTSGSLTSNGFNDQVTISCEDGLEFVSGETSMTLTCNKFGQFDKEAEPCRYVKGIVTEWTEYGPCKSICSGETVSRTRECINPPDSDTIYQLKCDEDTSPQYKQCKIDETCVSVYASLTTQFKATSSSGEDIVYDEVSLDKSGVFDGTHFTAPADGVYHFSLSSGTTGDAGAILTLEKQNGDVLATLGIKAALVTDVDTIARNFLVELSQGDRVKVVLEDDSTTDGLGGSRLTSLTVFSYSALMKDNGVAFMVGYDADADSTQTITNLFDDTAPVVNIGKAFIEGSGSFSVPRNGIYFLSFSIFADNDLDATVTFTGTLQSETTFALKNDGTNKDFTVSMSLLLELKSGDTVAAVNTGSTGNYIGSDGLETSFSGFLYEPRLVEPIAFFVVNTAITGEQTSGIEVLNFDKVMLDVGDSFFRSRLMCKVSGIYYFYFSTQAKTVNVEYDLKLMKNNEVLGAINVENLSAGSEKVSGRSVIVDLKVGDDVYVNVPAETHVEKETVSFLGMILQ